MTPSAINWRDGRRMFCITSSVIIYISLHNITGYVKVPRDGDSIWSLIIRSEDKYSRQDLKLKYLCVISCFRRELDESCALLGHYAVSGGCLLPTFWDSLSDPIFRGSSFEDGTDRLSRNVGKKLPLLAA